MCYCQKYLSSSSSSSSSTNFIATQVLQKLQDLYIQRRSSNLKLNVNRQCSTLSTSVHSVVLFLFFLAAGGLSVWCSSTMLAECSVCAISVFANDVGSSHRDSTIHRWDAKWQITTNMWAIWTGMLMLMLKLMHSIYPCANLVTKLRQLRHEGCLQ